MLKMLLVQIVCLCIGSVVLAGDAGKSREYTHLEQADTTCEGYFLKGPVLTPF